jgi:uncharacterized membrane protein
MLKTPATSQTALAGIEKKLTGNVPDDSDVPVPLRKAARFMLAGAGITVVFAVFEAIVLLADRNAIGNINGKPPTSAQVGEAVLFVLVEYGILTAIWILMARLNRAGRTWARWAGSALFVIASWQLYSVVHSVSSAHYITVADIIYIVLIFAMWLAGMAAIAMLWRPESSVYFRERSAR